MTFGQVDVGPVMATAGGAWIGTLFDELPLHVPPLMVMPRLTLPLGPAVYWIELVPWPEVIVPLAIVHEYVAPLTALTPALLPLLFAQTAAAVVMTGDGEPASVTVLLALALQLPFETVTLYVVVTDGESVMVCVVAPFDQRYEAKPGPASRVIGVPAQKVVGPVMLTIGAGLTVTDCGALVALQPFAVTVTLKLPEPTTLIDCVVAPFDQT